MKSTIDHVPTKKTNRFQMGINSLRQKSNSTWQDFSNIYARFLIRYPWSIFAVSSFITIGLTVCFLLFMQIRPFDQNDFLISHGQAIRNSLRLREIFGNDSELRMHQQLNLYPGLDIIIKRKVDQNETNMLNNETLNEILLLDNIIQGFRINKSTEYDYSSLCLKIDSLCIIDGNYILTERFRKNIYELEFPKSGLFLDDSGANGVPDFMFGQNYQVTNVTAIVEDYKEEVDEEDKQPEAEDGSDEKKQEAEDDVATIFEAPPKTIISYAPLLRLRYSLRTSTPQMQQLSIAWEKQILRYLNEEYQSLIIDIFPSTSTAITDTIAAKAHKEGIYMIAMIGLFFILFCVSLIMEGNFHTSVGYLPVCGILSIALSTGATFGFLSLCRIEIIEPMALLTFIVVIVDCLRFSIVCGEYHRVIKEHLLTITDLSTKSDIENILPSILRSTHPYVIISTLIISIVYTLFSLISPMFSTKLICLTLVLYVIVDYLVYATFFTSCLVITLNRFSSRRHSFFCFRLSNDYHTSQKSPLNLIQKKLYSLMKFGSIWKTFAATILALSSVAFVISSIWFGLSIDTRLFDDRFLPRDAYSLRAHMKSQTEDFNIGPMIMFTIPETVDYENQSIRSAMYTLIDRCNEENRTNSFRLIWLDKEDMESIRNKENTLVPRLTPFSRNDLIILEKHNDASIVASRFYCQYSSIKGDREDIQTMRDMYTYASQSSLTSVFPYSLLFPTYESLAAIRIEVYLLVSLLILCCFIVTLILLVSLRDSILASFHLFALLTGTLTCIYIFHDLSLNFANALWLYVLPVVFLDTLMHTSYQRNTSKWQYNRVILSLIISLIVLYVCPIQSYVFQIIRDTLMYQSNMCLLFINVILPSWHYFFQPARKNQSISKAMTPTPMTDGKQSLTDVEEIKNTSYESPKRNIPDSI